METVGNRIKQRRNELKLTQKQIHTETGISSGNLSDIENGKVLPSSAALINLSNILQCSIDWILKGDSPNSENLKTENTSIQNEFLSLFNELTDEDQEDIIELMEFKVLKKQRNETLSTLEPGEKSNSIA